MSVDPVANVGHTPLDSLLNKPKNKYEDSELDKLIQACNGHLIGNTNPASQSSTHTPIETTSTGMQTGGVPGVGRRLH